tara:strand:+ start:372 stop:563 length:192 start_codon:yes stop_codon:yes gene_type:complete
MITVAWRILMEQQTMNPSKQHQKLLHLNQRAEDCSSREEALKILKKASKIFRKLDIKRAFPPL